MKRKIFATLLVLFGWTMSANAQTLKFLPDTNEKSILVFKQSKSGDTLVFLKKVVIPDNLAKKYHCKDIIFNLNYNQNDSFVFKDTITSKRIEMNKYYTGFSKRYSTHYVNGYYFSDSLNFKSFEFSKEFTKSHYSIENVLLQILEFILFMILSFLIIFISWFLSSQIIGSIKMSTLILGSIFSLLILTISSSDIWTNDFINLSLMTYLLLPVIIATVLVHFLQRKFKITSADL